MPVIRGNIIVRRICRRNWRKIKRAKERTLIKPAYLEPKKRNKILFSGLSLVGTTTVAYALCNGIAPPKALVQHSTIDYERFALRIGDLKMTVYDLAGQETYHYYFLKELAEFIFTLVEVFVFVVDPIQFLGISRTKKYLDLSIQQLDRYSPDAVAYVYLHKFDQIPASIRQEVHESIQEYLTENQPKPMTVYNTSIYDDSLRTANKEVLYQILGIDDTYKPPEITDFWLFTKTPLQEPEYVKHPPPPVYGESFLKTLREYLKINREDSKKWKR